MSRPRPLPDCPQCGKSGTVREILWGEPASDYDSQRYELGGCLLTGNDPELCCLECEWSGWWED